MPVSVWLQSNENKSNLKIALSDSGTWACLFSRKVIINITRRSKEAGGDTFARSTVDGTVINVSNFIPSLNDHGNIASCSPYNIYLPTFISLGGV